ncbi:MAG: methyltransferase domain-containing protein [Desulfobaccales bacterium]
MRHRQFLASHLPLVDESFDGVMCILAMDFMPEREIALREMVAAATKSGTMATKQSGSEA